MQEAAHCIIYQPRRDLGLSDDTDRLRPGRLHVSPILRSRSGRSLGRPRGGAPDTACAAARGRPCSDVRARGGRYEPQMSAAAGSA